MRKDLKIQEETKEVWQVLNDEISRNEETCQDEEDMKSPETDSLDQNDSETTPESVVSAASSFQTPSNKKLRTISHDHSNNGRDSTASLVSNLASCEAEILLIYIYWTKLI